MARRIIGKGSMVFLIQSLKSTGEKCVEKEHGQKSDNEEKKRDSYSLLSKQCTQIYLKRHAI